MKNLLFVLFMFVVAMAATPALAQALNPAKVAADAAAGPVALSSVRELQIQLAETNVALAKAQADVCTAKKIGGAALTRAKKVEASLEAKVSELEGKLSSEATKAQAEVDKAAVEATVKIVGIQHGVSAPTPAPGVLDRLVSGSTVDYSTPVATGLERLQCAPGTTYERISVTDGVLRAGHKERCIPIPGYVSPDAPKAGHTTGDYLVACGIGAGSTALVALAIPGVSNFSSDVEVSGADYGVAAAAGAGVGCLGGILFTALGD